MDKKLKLEISDCLPGSTLDIEFNSSDLKCHFCSKDFQMSDSTIELSKIYKDLKSFEDFLPICQSCRDNLSNNQIEQIVEAILNNLDLRDILSSRLVNTYCNKNALRLLSRPKFQKLVRPTRIDTEQIKFSEILSNSQNPDAVFAGLYRKLNFGFNRQPMDFENAFKIINFCKPYEIVFEFRRYFEGQIFDFDGFLEFLRICSQTVVNLSLAMSLEDSDYEQVEAGNWPEMIFPKLVTLDIEQINNLDFLKVLTKNCPSLSELKLSYLPGPSRQNFLSSIVSQLNCLQKLNLINLSSGRLSNELPALVTQLHLKSFKIGFPSIHGHSVSEADQEEISNINSFIENQRDFLEEIEISQEIYHFYPIGTENEDTVKIVLAKCPKLKTLKLLVQSAFNSRFEPTLHIWPVRPINLPEICPTLEKISFNYTQGWDCLFELGHLCTTVKELSLDKWNDGDFNKISNFFPNVESLHLKNVGFSAVHFQFGGWAETLQSINIETGCVQLEKFVFEDFECLKSLKELNFKENYAGSCVKYPVNPDFAPLFKMDSLRKLSLIHFRTRLPKETIELLQTKFSNFECKY